MQCDENRSPLRIRNLGPIVEGRVFIRLPRQDHAESLSLKRNSQQARETQDDVAFSDAG
jgi:hypothetical protein